MMTSHLDDVLIAFLGQYKNNGKHKNLLKKLIKMD